MINISYETEELCELIDPNIDKVSGTDIYIRLSRGEDNVIYNAIHDPVTGSSCYPDMLLKHSLTEREISDSTLWQTADAAIRRYGSSRCYFLSLKDTDIFYDFIKMLHEIYKDSTPRLSADSHELIEKFGNDLMLSATMMHSFRNLMSYYAETGGDVYGLLTPFMEEYPLPVTTKQKGKQIYELIRNQILC